MMLGFPQQYHFSGNKTDIDEMERFISSITIVCNSLYLIGPAILCDRDRLDGSGDGAFEELPGESMGLLQSNSDQKQGTTGPQHLPGSGKTHTHTHQHLLESVHYMKTPLSIVCQ